ncbi:MAG: Wzz/FepE/Etk N-terminal domain-containing protein [Providencia heimbachae]|nr:Wzz/FepE/Etk N-terminal domain-containing protein [Providencia heimbachae]
MHIQNQNNPDEIDLLDILKTLWKGKKWLIAISGIFLLIGILATFLWPAQFTTRTLISPPTLLTLGNSPEALTLSDNPPGPLSDLSQQIFAQFIARLEGEIEQNGQRQNLELVRVKNTPNYWLISKDATPQKAVEQLTTFLTAHNEVVKSTLYQSITSRLNYRKQYYALILTSQLTVAQKKQAQRHLLWKNAAVIAEKNNILTHQLPAIADNIPEEALFMLGTRALTDLKNQDNSPLPLSDIYYGALGTFESLTTFSLQLDPFQAYQSLSLPTLPASPSSPKTRLIIALSLLLGVICGSLVVLVKSAW